MAYLSFICLYVSSKKSVGVYTYINLYVVWMDCAPAANCHLVSLDTRVNLAPRLCSAEPLSGLAALETLTLSECAIGNCDFASGMRRLKTLYADTTGIVDLAPLSDCTRLEFLHVGNCRELRNLVPLTVLPKLNWLNLSCTSVDTVEALRSCRALKTLHLSYTKVSDISALSTLPILSHLNLSYTSSIRTIACLETCPSLKEIDIRRSRIFDTEFAVKHNITVVSN